MGAMISTVACVFCNIFSKKGLKGNSVSRLKCYAYLPMSSLLFRTPFALAVEGPQMWAAGSPTALSKIGPLIFTVINYKMFAYSDAINT
jgi:solute carrier family 35, member E1